MRSALAAAALLLIFLASAAGARAVMQQRIDQVRHQHNRRGGTDEGADEAVQRILWRREDPDRVLPPLAARLAALRDQQ